MDDVPGALPPGQPRAALVEAVTAALRHLDERVAAVVACSGGADSTALAFLVAEARPDLGLTLVHVRHGLRDDARDAAVARQHASWLGVDHVEQDVEVVRGRHGTEAAARAARYGALRKVATKIGAATIVVGHTADDQAETVLLRLARGTGIDGLAAMADVAGDITRPLLRLRREDVRRFVALEGLPCVEDPSNRDRAVRRVVVRHDVLPRLADVGPDPVGSLCRLAELAREDAAALTDAAKPLLEQVRWVGTAAAVPLRALRSAPRSLAARAVREVLIRIGGQAPSAAVAARVLDAGSARAGASGASLPGGVDLSRSRGWLTLASRQPPTSLPVRVPDRDDAPWRPAGRLLQVVSPAAAAAPEAMQQLPLGLEEPAWALPRVRIPAAGVPPGVLEGRLAIPVPDRLAGGPLVVRHRRGGDRIATPAGTKRVAQLATDAGLPRPFRPLWPVVASGDQVVWYPGIAADRELLAAGRAAPARLLVFAPAPGGDGGPER